MSEAKVIKAVGSEAPHPAGEAAPGMVMVQTESISEQNRHVDKVLAAAAGSPAGGHDSVGQSWLRSLGYKLDPTSKARPTILTEAEVVHARGPVDRIASLARDELDRLFASVRHASYAILLSNNRGVIVDHRGERDEADRHRFWGSWLGAVWSEEVEGTNGIGTCLVEQRPITIHRTQHFRGRHIGLSCSSAPIFDPEGRLIAVLDAASTYPDLSDSAHALAGALAIAAARAIEERLFREAYRACWICAVRPESAQQPGMLFAIDRSLHVVGTALGASAFMRAQMSSDVAHPHLWSIFERQPDLLRAVGGADQAVRLVPVSGPPARFALLTPPQSRPDVAWSSRAGTAHHTLPRLDLLSRFLPPADEIRVRGGLSAAALRRVREHVEAHLQQNLDLQAMANAAGLSLHHFARAFKETEGTTPHAFLMQRRIERSKQLLASNEYSLAEVALRCGFADQSHFARTFRRLTGTTPGSFRHARG